MNDELMTMELEQEMAASAFALAKACEDLGMTRSKAASAMMMVIMRDYEDNPSEEWKEALANLLDGVSTMLKNDQPFFDESVMQ